MRRFAGFELDRQRAELRGRDGEPIKLRPKSFDMLVLLADNPGRVLTKQELIETIWPNVHVSEDSLFQCIREIRGALGDDRRELIRVISGRGYLFDAEVSTPAVPPAAITPTEALSIAAAPVAEAEPATPAPRPGRRLPFPIGSRAALAAAIAFIALIGLVAAAPMLKPDLIFARKTPAIAVMPIAATGSDRNIAGMAADVTDRLTDGLARIEGIRVVASGPQLASASPQQAGAPGTDFVLSGELQKGAQGWEVHARLTSATSSEVKWAGSVAVDGAEGDAVLQQSRLAAGIGHPLALRINALINSGRLMQSGSDGELPSGKSKVVIDQATAIINQTSRERFRDAQAMLEKALSADPDDVDLEIALSSHLLRGIQSVWADPAEISATEARAQSILERALKAKPSYIPALEAYCRFFETTSRFSESLVACARALSFDPWDGVALFNLGMTQVMQGRFEESLSTFKQADQFGTPHFARWTWLLGAGVTCAMMERNEEAASWLERSLAITPGTGRTQILLAAVYEQLGRHEEAKTAMAKGLALRPGSNVANNALPKKNASPVFLAASDRLIRIEVGLGLPEK